MQTKVKLPQVHFSFDCVLFCFILFDCIRWNWYEISHVQSETKIEQISFFKSISFVNVAKHPDAQIKAIYFTDITMCQTIG